MAINHDVEEYLNHYCTLSKAEFAIMINGPWGSGKTYFIKDYFDRQKAQNNNPTFPHLYASLYGVRSTSEITDQFFAQVQPLLNSKAARIFGSAASRLLSIVLQGEILSEKEDRSIIKDMLLKLDGRVLIFDDLERCAMPLDEVIGFINAYVEHDGHKVILIVNEHEILDNQKESYQKKKEKLIGKTLQVMPEPSAVFDSFIDEVKTANMRASLHSSKESLLRIFNSSKKRNFRSLRFVLSDYERLVSSVDVRLQESPAAISKLLHFMMAVGIEYRSGSLTISEIENLPTTERAMLRYVVGRNEKTPDALKFENLEVTYPDVDWHDPIIPLAALGKLFDTGVIDTAQINQHIAEHPLIVGYTESPAWRQLWRWIELPRSQYLVARKQLVAELQERRLTHPGIIMHAAGIVLSVIDLDDHILGDEDVVEFFDRYVQEVQAADTLDPARELFDHMARSYGNLGYHSEESPEFRRIKTIVKEATSEAFRKFMRGVATGYLDRIRGQPEACSSLHEYGVESGNYADAAFLHYIDPNEFAALIIKDSMPDFHLLACLQARYEHEMHNGALLAPEYPWLKDLRLSLEATAVVAQPPHKRLIEKRIEHIFEKIDEAVRKAEATGLEGPMPT